MTNTGNNSQMQSEMHQQSALQTDGEMLPGAQRQTEWQFTCVGHNSGTLISSLKKELPEENQNQQRMPSEAKLESSQRGAL